MIEARNADGAAAVIRLSSHDHPAVCHLDGHQWTPAIARLPALGADFFGGDFNRSIATPRASMALAAASLPGLGYLRMADARIRIWEGLAGDPFPAFVLRADARVIQDPRRAGSVATIEFQPADAWLDRPLLAIHAGTGGIEGPEDIEGAVKPLVLGNCRFVPGVLVDAVDNVWRVSCYGAVQDISSVYDRVVSLGSSTGDYSTLGELLAASIPPGRWATCKAQGLVRLGAPPDGRVAFDVAGDAAGAGGYVRRPGAMIGRIAELAGGEVAAGNLAALDAARPWNLSLVLNSQSTARGVIQQIADSVVAVAGVSWTGKLFVQPLGYGAESLTLAADGSALPPVAEVTMEPVAAPFWRLATRAEITWSVHDVSEAASEYMPRGRYSATRSYRLDDMVDLADGSIWVYINATPGAGNAPPAWPTASNAYWSNVTPPLTAEGISYADGTPIEDLRPIEASADLTASLDSVAPVLLQAEYTGVISAGQLPRNFFVVRRKGGVDVSTSTTWTIESQSGITGGTVTVSSAGTVTIPTGVSVAANATIQVRSLRDGKTMDAYIAVQKNVAPPPNTGSAGGTTVNDSTFTAITGTSHVAISDLMTVKTGSGGQIQFSAPLSLTAAHAAPEIETPDSNVAMKWRYRPIGGSWADVAGEVNSSPDLEVFYNSRFGNYLGTDGEIDCSPLLTGLSANTEYEVQLHARRTSSTPTKTIYFTGTAAAIGG